MVDGRLEICFVIPVEFYSVKAIRAGLISTDVERCVWIVVVIVVLVDVILGIVEVGVCRAVA